MTQIVLVATDVVHPRKLDDYRTWSGQVDVATRATPGFLASIRLEQPGGLFHLAQHFASIEALSTWQASEEYRQLVSEGETLAVSLRQTASGDPARLDLPGESSAPKWKTFLVTWLAVLPLLLVLSSGVRAALPMLPPLAQSAISSIFLTSALTWLILPVVQRRARHWMLRDAAGRVSR